MREIDAARALLRRARPFLGSFSPETDPTLLKDIDAALSGPPGPDPAEAMRAKCEAIARRVGEGHPPSAMRKAILDAIAALKGKGGGP